MSISIAALEAVRVAVTSAASGDAKGVAMGNGMVEAAIKEMTEKFGVITPQQRVHVDLLKAELVSNAGLFTTALAA